MIYRERPYISSFFEIVKNEILQPGWVEWIFRRIVHAHIMNLPSTNGIDNLLLAIQAKSGYQGIIEGSGVLQLAKAIQKTGRSG